MTAFITNLREGSDHSRIKPDFLESAGDDEILLPDSTLSADGRIVTEKLIAVLDQNESLRRFRPLVAVTESDLIKSGCGSIFGYADRKRRICVVSSARLGQPSSLLQPRLENVIRHELGHLRDLNHCRRLRCLMHPAQIPEDLDQRPSEPCTRCSRPLTSPGKILRRAFAGLFLVAVFAGMNLAASLLKPAWTPFSLVSIDVGAGVGGQPDRESVMRGRLLFNGNPLKDTASIVDAEAAPEELNRLYQLVDPPPLIAAARGSEQAVILSGGKELLRIEKDQALREARGLTVQLNELIEAKGTRSSLCAECHRERKSEVLEAAGRGWGIGPF